MHGSTFCFFATRFYLFIFLMNSVGARFAAQTQDV